MSEYVIVTDSSADLPSDYIEKNNIYVLPLKFYIENKEYQNYPDGRELDFHCFYEKMRSGEIATTSQVNVLEAKEIYESFLKDGKDVLAVAFSSGLSGTYNSCRLAAEELREEYPERKIYVIDSLCASLGEGLFVHYSILNRDKGFTIEENFRDLEVKRPHLCHWFTVDDIDTLVRGGRVSKVAGFAAKTLRIKPVLNVDDEGHLIPRQKKMGRKSSLRALVEMMDLLVEDKSEEITVFISHGDCIDDAKYVMNLVKEKFNVKCELINYVGPVIGAHSGPGTLALFFLGSRRTY